MIMINYISCMYCFSLIGYVPHHHRGHPLGLKVLDNPESQGRGFMGWEQPPNDQYGMLFKHSHIKPQSYWMQDVPFDLDCIGFDEDDRVVQVLHLKAHSKASRSFIRGVRHVVEVRGGWCRDHGIEQGSKLILGEL